jgi:putative Ca2+/H+ antiporter (TMEM165/GDT1 family)
MDAFYHSLLLVTIGEIGDKTQILAIILAAHYRANLPIIAGVLVATLLNHAIAASAGQWVTGLVQPDMLNLGVGVLFIGIGLWVLVPDSEDQSFKPWKGPFVTSLVAFFMAEMGDKTQLATITLGAQFPDALPMVILGTTLGMMIANVPAIFFGHAILKKIPMRTVRVVAALSFIAMGAMKVVPAAFS